MIINWWSPIPLLFIITLIILLISGKIRKIKFFTSLSLSWFAHSSFSIGLLISYKSPIIKERITQGPDIPYFPIVIGIIILGLAILCLFINKLSTRSPNRPVRFRWLWLLLGAVILFVGLCLAMIALYTPKVFGYAQVPLPGLACWFWLPFITIASPIFYKVSRMNSEASPNFMRYVVFFFACYGLGATSALSLIMIYGILGTKISYQFWGAIITLGFLPPSLVILGIAKDHLPVRILGQSSSTLNIAKNSEE